MKVFRLALAFSVGLAAGLVVRDLRPAPGPEVLGPRYHRVTVIKPDGQELHDLRVYLVMEGDRRHRVGPPPGAKDAWRVYFPDAGVSLYAAPVTPK